MLYSIPADPFAKNLHNTHTYTRWRGSGGAGGGGAGGGGAGDGGEGGGGKGGESAGIGDGEGGGGSGDGAYPGSYCTPRLFSRGAAYEG